MRNRRLGLYILMLLLCSLGEDSHAHSIHKSDYHLIHYESLDVEKVNWHTTKRNENDDIMFTLFIYGKNRTLSMTKNEDLVPMGASFTIFKGINGTLSESISASSQSTFYKGSILTENSTKMGWARLIVDNMGNIKGSFFDSEENELYTIEELTMLHKRGILSAININANRVVYKWSNLKREANVQEGLCGMSHHDVRMQETLMMHHSMDMLMPNKGIYSFNAGSSKPPCPSTRKVVYLGIVADCTFSQKYGSPIDIQNEILSVVNQASEIYEGQLNIALSLVDLQILTDCNPNEMGFNRPCDNGYSVRQRLSDFGGWISQTSVNSHIGAYQLVRENIEQHYFVF